MEAEDCVMENAGCGFWHVV